MRTEILCQNITTTLLDNNEGIKVNREDKYIKA